MYELKQYLLLWFKNYLEINKLILKNYFYFMTKKRK